MVVLVDERILRISWVFGSAEVFKKLEGRKLELKLKLNVFRLATCAEINYFASRARITLSKDEID